MPFTGTGTGIQNANDVFFSSLAQDNFLKYDVPSAKWNNSSIVGFAATATRGGQETVSTNATASGALTLNLTNGNVFNLTLTGNVTSTTISNAVAGKACGITVYLKQDATGSRTVVWPTGTKWSGGAPTLSTAANAIDIVVLETLDGGTTWFGSLVGTNFA